MPEFGQSYAETRSSRKRVRSSGSLVAGGLHQVHIHTERIMQFTIIDCCASAGSDASTEEIRVREWQPIKSA